MLVCLCLLARALICIPRWRCNRRISCEINAICFRLLLECVAMRFSLGRFPVSTPLLIALVVGSSVRGEWLAVRSSSSSSSSGHPGGHSMSVSTRSGFNRVGNAATIMGGTSLRTLHFPNDQGSSLQQQVTHRFGTNTGNRNSNFNSFGNTGFQSSLPGNTGFQTNLPGNTALRNNLPGNTGNLASFSNFANTFRTFNQIQNQLNNFNAQLNHI